MRKFVSVLLMTLLFLTACQTKAEGSGAYYQIFVRSFADSDGDGIGDFKGIEDKLDYLVDLGIEGIWLTPIHPSPTYHGYDVIDYKAVHPDFGTLEDFQSLLDAVHARGMKLIIDFVINHSSSEHPYFIEAKKEVEKGACTTEDTYCHYYNFSNEALPHYVKEDSPLWYEAVFWSGMPDFNLDHPELREELIEAAAFWLEMGVDGFRLDATSHFYEGEVQKNTEFLAWFQKSLRSLKEDIYIVAEAWEPSQIRLAMYESGVDSFFNFDVSEQDSILIQAIRKNQGEAFGKKMHAYHQEMIKRNPQAIDAIFLSNHDQGRSAAYFMGDEEKQRFAANVYLLMPGRPFIYYGEEIAMKGSGKDENKRLAIPWGDGYEAKDPRDADYILKDVPSVREAQRDKHSLWSHYQKILKVRAKYPFLFSQMEYELKAIDPALYVYQLENYLVIHNFNQDTVQVNLEEEFKILEKINGDAKLQKDELFLEGYTSIILKLRK